MKWFSQLSSFVECRRCMSELQIQNISVNGFIVISHFGSCLSRRSQGQGPGRYARLCGHNREGAPSSSSVSPYQRTGYQPCTSSCRRLRCCGPGCKAENRILESLTWLCMNLTVTFLAVLHCRILEFATGKRECR
jgi:hypothetical protein